jgi:hypothetical protein
MSVEKSGLGGTGQAQAAPGGLGGWGGGVCRQAMRTPPCLLLRGGATRFTQRGSGRLRRPAPARRLRGRRPGSGRRTPPTRAGPARERPAVAAPVPPRAWSRRVTEAVSVTKARIRIAAPQCGQTSANTSSILASSPAHREAARSAGPPGGGPGAASGRAGALPGAIAVSAARQGAFGARTPCELRRWTRGGGMSPASRSRRSSGIRRSGVLPSGRALGRR